jgi:hypothetical protein
MFERRSEKWGEPLHWMWVLGERGAVSTWFSDGARDVLGHSVCNGASLHSPIRPADPDDWVHESACEFLEAPCWSTTLSALDGMAQVPAYDAGRLDLVWDWLCSTYFRWLVPHPDDEAPGPMIP